MKWMLMPLRRYADFHGRSRRKEYWLWVLFNFIVSALITVPLIILLLNAFWRVDERGGVGDWLSSYDGGSYGRSYDDDRDRGSYRDDHNRYDSDRYDSDRYDDDYDRGGYSYHYRYGPDFIDMEMLMEELSPAAWVLMGLSMLWGLFTFIPNLAVAIRRLHDTDRSGWTILLGLIPLVGAIILFVFLLTDGTRGPNRFGPDPKGMVAASPPYG